MSTPSNETPADRAWRLHTSTGDAIKIDRNDDIFTGLIGEVSTPYFIQSLKADHELLPELSSVSGPTDYPPGTFLTTISFEEALGNFYRDYFGPNATKPRPQNIEEFINKFRTQAGIVYQHWNAEGNSYSISERHFPHDAEPTDGLHSNNDFSAYRDLRNEPSVYLEEPTDDLVDLFPNAEFAQKFAGLTENERIHLQAVDAFNAFLRYGRTPPDTGNGSADFATMYNNWWQRTTELSADVAPFAGTGINLQSYSRIYDAYLPGESIAFAANLETFVNEHYQKEGYFLPSHFLEQWVDEVKDAAARRGALPFNTLEGEIKRVNQALILNSVFDLLVEMIGVIQKVASALAQRLQFYADYQRQITKLMDQMPIFTAAGPAASLKVEGDDVKGIRGDANASNQAALEKLRAHRDIAGDETKQMQTTVNQLNDAASQQANIATAILQQLSGILTLIFR
ncbi:hypothetical protein SCG7086_AN_00220 [Chlamydiales bacterium SCGC AG-110-P3]|nr:hypothetical protein SCG7086_AN_00220 [Chlamydiales bacterium SCGC AG-110-P3]